MGISILYLIGIMILLISIIFAYLKFTQDNYNKTNQPINSVIQLNNEILEKADFNISTFNNTLDDSKNITIDEINNNHSLNTNDTNDEDEIPENFFTFGKLLDPKINLRYIEKFLTMDECFNLMVLGEKVLEPSKVVDKIKNEDLSKHRTSYSGYLHKSISDPLIKSIRQRVVDLFNGTITDSQIEHLQVVKYFPGQYFGSHYDWFDYDHAVKVGQRLYTIFVYLNNVYNEGETYFPKLNIKVKPVMGDAAFWVNCKEENNCYKKSAHAGLPSNSDIKYGLNIWIHFTSSPQNIPKVDYKE